MSAAFLAQNRRWIFGALITWVTGGVVWNLLQTISYVSANRAFQLQTGLAHHFGLSGLLYTAVLTPFGVCMFIWGMLMDRLGPRRCSMAGLAIIALAELLLADAQTMGMVFWGLLLLGAGGGFFFPMAYVVGRVWMVERERGLYFMMIFTFMSVLGAVISPVTAWLITAFGWHAPFDFGLIVAIANLLLLRSVFRDAPDNHSRMDSREIDHIRKHDLAWTASLPSVAESLAEVTRNPRYWLALILLIANNVASFGYIYLVPGYFVAARHLTLVEAGLLSGAAGLAGAVCLAPVGGWIQDHTGRRARTAAVAAVLLIFVYGLAFLLPNPVDAALVLALFSGPLSGMLRTASHTVTVTLVRPRIVGTTVGVQSSLAQTLSSATPIAMAALISGLGLHYRAGFYLLMGVMAVGAVAAVRLESGKRNLHGGAPPQTAASLSDPNLGLPG